MDLCDCGTALKTLGTVNCPAMIGRAYKFAFTPYYKTDGTVNELDLSASPTLNAAYFAALIIASANQPWNVSPVVKNFMSGRDDDKTEEFNNGTELEFVQSGMRKMTGVWVKVAANIADTIKGWNCTQMGVYVITDQGQILGMEGSGWLKLRPIKVAIGSFTSKFVMQSNTAINVQQAQVGFGWDSSECDYTLKMIGAGDFAVGYDIKSLNGLIQVELKPHLANTATTVKIAADTNQGTLITPVLVTGLTLSDFVVTNRTTGIVVTPSGVTEIAGKYVITYASQTGNLLSLAATKTGYQFMTYNYTSN